MLVSDALDERGMVMDFGDVKRIVKQWIDNTLDHTMLMNKNDPLIPMLTEQGEKFYVMEDNPTVENIAKLIFGFVKEQGFPIKSVTLWESESSFARYSEKCGQ